MADLAPAETSRARKAELPGGVTVERSLREIRLTRSVTRAGPAITLAGPAYEFLLPGEIRAPEYAVCLRGELASVVQSETVQATLRPWKAGDRVTLRHSRGPKKVAEVLDRLHVLGEARKNWPVVESGGRIVWMRGVEVDVPRFRFTAQSVPE
jgi:tRNA(Ile)-lysidine synthetase-like protein